MWRPRVQRTRAARLGGDVAAPDHAALELRRHPDRQSAARGGGGPSDPRDVDPEPRARAPHWLQPSGGRGVEARGAAAAAAAAARRDLERRPVERRGPLLLLLLSPLPGGGRRKREAARSHKPAARGFCGSPREARFAFLTPDRTTS